MPMSPLSSRVLAEGLGTWLLVAAVVGSGIMADRLAGDAAALALLANTLATGAALVAIILALQPISGAHLNPAVTLAAAGSRDLAWTAVAPYVTAQVTGGLLGTITAHLMFGEPVLSASVTARAGVPLIFAEAVATFGLVLVIMATARSRPDMVAYAVGAYITAAYWFTASTSFANPAVTIARTLTDTFAGIRPLDAPAFIAAQLVGALAAGRVCRILSARSS
jgi:glycerol uptake facilitator-like aquaporin